VPAINRLLALHVRDRYGIVADSELRELGISVAQRRHLVEDGLLVPLFDGVYRLASSPESLEGWCLAACLADERAVITGRAGGRLAGLRKMGAEPRIDVRVPHYSNTLTGPMIRLRRCSILDPEHVVTRSDGIRVVSPARLAFDLGAVMTDLDLESVIEQMLDRGWVTMTELHEIAHRMYHPRRPGSKRFVRVIQSRPAWLKPADSDLEVLLFDALRRRGVHGLVRQHAITLDGITIHPDLAVPDVRWAVEVDHVTWHGGRVDAQRDKQRDRGLRRIDWQVDRVTDAEIEHDLASVTAELLDLYHQRRRSLAA
jgi:very-short-patch-repair endonuclease